MKLFELTYHEEIPSGMIRQMTVHAKTETQARRLAKKQDDQDAWLNPKITKCHDIGDFPIVVEIVNQG